MSRHAIVRFGIVLFVVVIVGVGLRYSGPVMAEIGTGVGIQYSNMSLFRIGISQPEAQPSQLAKVQSESQVESSVNGALLTQTFTLNEGWNSIYLEVEPINNSPLINVGTAEEPIMAPELSTIEAVFTDLTCTDCLESVWTWNVPLTTVDYIVDPAEGLWDEPGWQHYFPEHNLGPDGVSRAFLTNLFSLQANKGYLVKLKDGAGSATLAVQGKPVVEHHHWLQDSYNLAGFPIDPDASPSVATFFHNLAGGSSALTEVRALNADGTWGVALPANTALDYGEAYLVYFNGGDPDAATDYTAPLNIISYVGDGLEFTPGFSGNTHFVRIENLSDTMSAVQLSLLGDSAPPVHLKYYGDTTVHLWEQDAEFNIQAGQAIDLRFKVSSDEQTAEAEGLLEISSSDLGARWLVPLIAKRGQTSGLWLGDVVVNDVSEGRLGSTNVASGTLTISLRPVNESGVNGAVVLIENELDSSVDMTGTLVVPSPDDTPALDPISATVPYVGGYVFEDANQNGQRDADEVGLADVVVTLGGQTQQTGEDGSYLFESIAPGTLSVSAEVPTGYTKLFEVILPNDVVTTNAVPASVTLDAGGITDLLPVSYSEQVVSPPHTLPFYDAEYNRVEPLLNFGYVSTYDAYLQTGVCADRSGSPMFLGEVKNGIFIYTLTDAALNPQPVTHRLVDDDHFIYVQTPDDGGVEVACGEIVVGAPTYFSNGLGSQFTFRLLLRVDNDGNTELLPFYVNTEGERTSSAVFSIQEPIVAPAAVFGDTLDLLDFFIVIDPDDPLNPYKHKYHPDHDNLDAKFNRIDFDDVDEHLWESYEVRRRIQLQLSELPPVPGADEALAEELDWGGGIWGGYYKEVIEGIHKNDITVRGYFVIRHVLNWEDLEQQGYDSVGGGGG